MVRGTKRKRAKTRSDTNASSTSDAVRETKSEASECDSDRSDGTEDVSKSAYEVLSYDCFGSDILIRILCRDASKFSKGR